MQDYFLGKEDEVGLLVRGGLYEVDLRQRRLKACYWPEPSHRVMRGTWFLEKSPDWVPLKVRPLHVKGATLAKRAFVDSGKLMTGGDGRRAGGGVSQ